MDLSQTAPGFVELVFEPTDLLVVSRAFLLRYEFVFCVLFEQPTIHRDLVCIVSLRMLNRFGLPADPDGSLSTSGNATSIPSPNVSFSYSPMV